MGITALFMIFLLNKMVLTSIQNSHNQTGDQDYTSGHKEKKIYYSNIATIYCTSATCHIQH